MDRVQQGPPIGSKGVRTRQHLLDAAVVRFGRDGYRGSSVAEIARDVGLSAPAAYVYFPNKEALFLAAVDEDAAAVIDEGLTSIADSKGTTRWRRALIVTLFESVDHHPLARRVLAGLEPDFTVRLLHIPALEQMRKACGERVRARQLAGQVSPDIDAFTVGSGLVTVVLSLLMSSIQMGVEPATLLGSDVAAFVDAALGPPTKSRRPRSTSERRP
ncbi:MAG TPA: TetR/AcrR family transcriptional regulator [Acidimicrobiales bacterium]|jgi:AcrR family transcriptional regulator|nr:TetR/AcrR family transcriptional regulator [Acidimicrobiales bacterium]